MDRHERVIDDVARAIADANNGDEFDHVSDLVKELYRDEARAAVKAFALAFDREFPEGTDAVRLTPWRDLS